MNTCRICGLHSEFFGKSKVLNKYEVNYYRCGFCNFIQTEEPYWLDEAYAHSITHSDVGLVGRNIRAAKLLNGIIPFICNPQRQFVDFGGGYGMLVRMMRDRGFNFKLWDKFSPNLFAKGHGATEGDHYEMVTAFEVFEHLVHPITDIEKILDFSRQVLFSTLLVPSTCPQPSQWWYYGLEHGQHVSFYSRRTLEFVGQKHALNFVSNGSSLHMFSEKKISPFLFRSLTHAVPTNLMNLIYRKKSLLSTDFSTIKGKEIAMDQF